jgi:diguanylate cyclase (GGDEF)-like protein
MMLDLDHFKSVNDAMGHAAGDLLLKGVASRLAGCVREGDVAARLGGDEFSVLLTGIADANGAADVAARILHALSTPIPVGDVELPVGVSIGISLYPQDGDDPDVLLKNADAAMYRAKEGRGRYEFWSLHGSLPPEG